ncbi:aminoacyl-tRNA hydrolase [Francisellaceae bacterium]|nr:aminoacyl-tRNA hydrolase [Francisellaceae bacterium]
MHVINLIVGLGNPGDKYLNTRHNAGEWFISRLAEKYNITLKLEKKFNAYFGRIQTSKLDCFLLFPTTFMNRSGLSVHQVCSFFKISPENILVCHDELDLPCGTIRLKFSGGHGGHNGLRDIQAHLGKNFYRLRIGIDRPKIKNEVINYVLNVPSKPQFSQIEDSIEQALIYSDDIIEGKIPHVMNQLHTQQGDNKNGI